MARQIVDLRSDTVTRPTREMRAAMAAAEVGDDVFRDDPTVNSLEARAAELLGKESALFVASGTMGNQVALWTHSRRGNEVICGRPCHIQEHEVGASAVISGVTLAPLDAPTGQIALQDLKSAIRSKDIHNPETALICLECAHGSGAVQPLEYLQATRELARNEGLPIHMDGARIFNAALHLGVEAKAIADCADSVMFCLSKGLGAPVGSLLCGKGDFIERARKGRKMLGGGMRQVGILAAAGLHALDHNLERLEEDHRRAGRLAEALRNIPGITLFEKQRDINMVWFSRQSGEGDQAMVEALAKRGVLVLPLGECLWRLVTHLDIDDEKLDYAIEQIKWVMAAR